MSFEATHQNIVIGPLGTLVIISVDITLVLGGTVVDEHTGSGVIVGLLKHVKAHVILPKGILIVSEITRVLEAVPPIVPTRLQRPR